MDGWREEEKGTGIYLYAFGNDRGEIPAMFPVRGRNVMEIMSTR